MNNYREFINAVTATMDKARGVSLDNMSPCARPEIPETAPRVLLFSPHPDDECITGALPLRLLREDAFNVINVAVTLGSRKDRRDARLEELRQACDFLGFNLIQTEEKGLERIKPVTRRTEPEHWDRCAHILKNILEHQQPRLIFLPHADDWNGTHIGTHQLVMDALTKMEPGFSCAMIETEYWRPMIAPNLMVECLDEVVADLVAGLSHHQGEVARNPYHLLLPAWMQDNVRRGGELIGGQGGEAPDFHFATIYRLKRWRNGGVADTISSPSMLDAGTSPATALQSVIYGM